MEQAVVDIQRVRVNDAAALFAAAEQASADAVSALIARAAVNVVPTITAAAIRYRTPARGTVTAIPTLARHDDTVTADLRVKGRASLGVSVDLVDEAGSHVAVAEFAWLLRATDGERGANAA